MKEKTLKIFKIIVFTILLLVCVVSVYNVLAWKDTSGEYLSTMKQLYATQDNRIDAVFVGSSHVYCGVYPAKMWQDRGIAGFNMAVSGMDKQSAYYDVVELLKTQNPKVICVDLYPSTFEEHADQGNVYRNYLSKRLSKNAVDHVNSYIPKEERSDYIFRFPIVHTRYKELQKYDFIPYEFNRYGRGDTYSDRIQETYFDESVVYNEETPGITESNREWVDKFAELSAKKGFALEFMLVPYRYTVNERLSLNSTIAYINEKGIPVTDYSRKMADIGLDGMQDFIDDGHLNNTGAEKYTEALMNDVLSKYDIPNHSGEKGYELWEEDHHWYDRKRIQAGLNATQDGYLYMTKLADLDEAVSVISLEYNYADESLGYFGMFEPLGMSYEEFSTGGKWIYADGVLTKVSENDPAGQPFIYEINKRDSLRVMYRGDFNQENISLNKEAVMPAGYNVTVVTYDLFLEEILENRGF